LSRVRRPSRQIHINSINISYDEYAQAELAQTYTRRWPAQENIIKDFLLPLGLDTNHGYAKTSRVPHTLDELQRRIQLEALPFGFAGAGILTFSYGFLEGMGFPHLNWIFVWPLMIALWGLGGAIARRKYS
jgi:hypothetical protein